MSRKYFGTDGIRGIAPVELTPELSVRVGLAAQKVLGKENSSCLLGCDTRVSSDLIKSALASGLLSGGCNVFDAGVVSTPAVSFLTVHYGLSYGGVVSASHNPFEYNGIKFFDSSGMKLSDQTEIEIEKLIESDENLYCEPSKVGRLFEVEDAVEVYSNYVSGFVSSSIQGRIAFDCANGATSVACLKFARKAGLDAEFINTEPDGFNINENCGATHPEVLSQYVVEKGLAGGFAFDGDGDRVIVVDEKGRVINGDQLIGFLALYYKRAGILKSDFIVGTVMSNYGLEIMLEQEGLRLERANVGDRYVLEKMLDLDTLIGGEDSGHIILLDRAKTGDGLVVAATLLNIIAERGLKFSDFFVFEPVPRVLLNVKVKDKRAFEKDSHLNELISVEAEKIKDVGRIVVRPSGTEPVVRVMVEARELEVAEKTASKIAKVIEERLG